MSADQASRRGRPDCRICEGTGKRPLFFSAEEDCPECVGRNVPPMHGKRGKGCPECDYEGWVCGRYGPRACPFCL
jgi:hypothetical protein